MENTAMIEISPDRVNEYRARARKDARNDPAGAGSCNGWRGTLRQIANDVAKQMGGVFDNFRQKCDEAYQQASGSHRDIRDLLSPESVKALDADAQKRVGEAIDILGGLRKDAGLMKKFGERFPNLEQRIQAPPHNPNKVLFVGFAIFLIAVESLINAKLFAAGDDYGIFGGALTAVYVSCANVVPMLLLGIFATKARGNLDFPQWGWRAICGFALVLAVFVNIVILTIRRSKMIEAAERANADGLLNIGRDLLARADDPSQSILLFVVGMVIAGLAFNKGWKFPDLYEKVRECQRRMDGEKRRYSSQILGPIEGEIEKLRSAKKNLYGEIDQLKEAVGQWRIVSPILALKGVSEVQRVWQIYHDEYAPLHRDPDPMLPDIGAANAKDWGVHIHDDWNTYAEAMGKNANDRSGVLESLLQEIGEMIQALLDLKTNLVAVITAELNNACA